jgi:hypothetical protein
MSQPHPTIPGVTVEPKSYNNLPAISLRMDQAAVFAECHNHSVEICTTDDICIDFYLDDAKMLGASITFAAAWLAEQNGGAE